MTYISALNRESSGKTRWGREEERACFVSETVFLEPGETMRGLESVGRNGKKVCTCADPDKPLSNLLP